MGRSVPQTPPAKTLTRISSPPMDGTGTSTSSSPGPASVFTSAFIALSILRWGHRRALGGFGEDPAVVGQRQAEVLRLAVHEAGDELHRQSHRFPWVPFRPGAGPGGG